MQADSEFNALIEMTSEELRRQNHARKTGEPQLEHSHCLIAVCQQSLELDHRLRIDSEAVVGTLDLYSAHAPAGQVLIGMCLVCLGTHQTFEHVLYCCLIGRRCMYAQVVHVFN